MEHRLATRARTATSSAIRDLLEQAGRPGMISLAGGLPDPQHFPTDRLADLADHLLRHEGPRVLQYGPTGGDDDLRTLAAARADVTDPDRVVITTGSQQGLHLLAQCLLDPGDTVVVGDPDYLGALQAWRGAGARLAPVAIDRDGLDTDALAALLADGLRPRLVYVVPHHHNPTGATLSDRRAGDLLTLAEEHDFLVVEDDPYRDLGFRGPPPAEAHDHPRRIRLRSVSKVLAPGLRVGWMVAPEPIAAAVERTKQAVDLHTSSLSQAIVAAALAAPWFERHVGGLRDHGRRQCDALTGAIEQRFGRRVEFARPTGGMFLWIRFTDGTDTTELLGPALERGVAFVPGASFAVAADLRHHARLSWATAPPDALVDAVARLSG